jgi:ubiquinone/menaquinone biosynthesis C-methylase UbiE
MPPTKHRVCPVQHAGALTFSLRKFIHPPSRILAPFIRPGMTVLDFGAGPGFFSLEMARLVGGSGKVIAADLQAGMLNKLRQKIQHTSLAGIITLHRTETCKINLAEKVDFVLLFYVLHELPDQVSFFQELQTCLHPGAKILIAEPKWHVSQKDFQNSIARLENTGFEILSGSKIFFSRTVVARTTAAPAE